MEAVVA